MCDKSAFRIPEQIYAKDYNELLTNQQTNTGTIKGYSTGTEFQEDYLR